MLSDLCVCFIDDMIFFLQSSIIFFDELIIQSDSDNESVKL
jgi:hypothetical protein